MPLPYMYTAHICCAEINEYCIVWYCILVDGLVFEQRVADAHLIYQIMNFPCRTRHHFDRFHFEKVCTLQNGHVHITYVNMLKLT